MSALVSSAAPAKPYSFHGHEVRVVMRDGTPWFVATDVAAALGYRNASDAARNLDARQKGTHILRTLKGNQELTVVSEGGLYRLVLRSRKPEAVAFCDWVTDEVLPSIRKTGSYSKPESMDLISVALPSPGRYLVIADEAGVKAIDATGKSLIPASDVRRLSRDMLTVERAMRMLGERLLVAEGSRDSTILDRPIRLSLA